MEKKAEIIVDKLSGLVDEEVVIQVKNLEPRKFVTIVATVTESSVGYYSYGCYEANSNGTVNVSKDASMSGTYKGYHPMGLFWSMTQQPGEAPGRRLMKRDVTTPIVITLSLFQGQIDGSVTLDESYHRKHCKSSVKVHRWYMGDGVMRMPLRGGRLKGTFFLPAGDGPFRAVVDMFGTVGGTVEYRSALLASRGIASLALEYFSPAEEKVLIDDLEYFESAVEFLLSQEKVCKSGVGVIGVSKGSDMALLTAVVCPKVRACISIGGLPFNTLLPHSYKGEVFQSYDPDGGNLILNRGHLTSFRPIFEKYMTESPPDDSVLIPVERSVNANFLIINGAEDASNPPVNVISIPTRLRAHGKSNYQVALYPGTGHLIEPPYSPVTTESYHSFLNAVIYWGGDPPLHAHAQKDSWEKILNFIRQHIPILDNETLSTKYVGKL